METGRTIYHKSNTVAAPHPNQKNRERRAIVAKAEAEAPLKVMEVTRKTCATSQCVWCQNAYPDGVYLIVCMMCHTCQYCGLVSHRNDACAYCGNILSEELMNNPAVCEIVYSNKVRHRL